MVTSCCGHVISLLGLFLKAFVAQIKHSLLFCGVDWTTHGNTNMLSCSGQLILLAVYTLRCIWCFVDPIATTDRATTRPPTRIANPFSQLQLRHANLTRFSTCLFHLAILLRPLFRVTPFAKIIKSTLCSTLRFGASFRVTIAVKGFLWRHDDTKSNYLRRGTADKS